MNKPIADMTRDELEAAYMRRGEALEDEQRGRQADKNAAATELNGLKAEHREQLRGLEQEVHRANGRTCEVELERDTARSELAVAQRQIGVLRAELATTKCAAAAVLRERDSARGWNVGLSLAALVVAVR